MKLSVKSLHGLFGKVDILDYKLDLHDINLILAYGNRRFLVLVNTGPECTSDTNNRINYSINYKIAAEARARRLLSSWWALTVWQEEMGAHRVSLKSSKGH